MGQNDSTRPPSHLAPACILVAGRPVAAHGARDTLLRSPLFTGSEVVACDAADLPQTLSARAFAALVLLADCDVERLPELVERVHGAQRDPLMSMLVRTAQAVPPGVAGALWDLGVADRQFGQPVDALADALAVALREQARQRMLYAVAEAPTALARVATLGEQAALALEIPGAQGYGRRGALFCFERNATGRQLLGITGTGMFAGADCTPVAEVADARLADLIEQAWTTGASAFVDDFAVLHVGERGQTHRALIVLALDAPLLPCQRRLLEAYASAVAPAIADQQRSHHLARTQHAMISTLARLAEYKDADTGEHVARVARITAEIASHLAKSEDIPEAEGLAHLIGHASILHDVGKVAIPESVLLKPGALDDAERRVINDHVTIGHDILREAAALAAHGEARLFHLASEIARFHHERWDGTGYPDGLRGEAIPLAARIVAVVDVYDALVSQRPYKSAWPKERAQKLIREESGRHFDPRVVDAFFAVRERKAAARFIEWTEDMSVGHPELDRDHQRLIGIINHLGVNMELGNRNIVEFILDDLADYAQVHFRREEAHLEAVGFPDLVRHRAIHNAISRRIEDAKWKYFQGFAATLESELLVFLTTWLNNHILVEDMRYSGKAAPT